ncbi:MAG: hypothetical protein IPH29_19420 [Candidatus Microthrix sp.]|nr:hypothetical protein [Candidatus Microthrix sp.]
MKDKMVVWVAAEALRISLRAPVVVGLAVPEEAEAVAQGVALAVPRWGSSMSGQVQ